MAALALADAAVLWSRLDRSGRQPSGGVAGSTTWLLVGSDRREDIPTEDRGRFGSATEVPGERADVIAALRVADDGAVHLLAIDRDLVLTRSGTGPARLATTLSDGSAAVADALCHSLGLGVDHVAVIRFGGMRDLVDLVGGVEVTSDAIVADRASGLLLRDGRNRLDGRLALAYVRARHIEVWDGERWVPDPVRSAQRPERATEVLRELGAAARVTWWNPLAVQRLAWTGTGALSVDGGTGPLDLLDLAGAARALTDDDRTVLPVRRRDGPGTDLLPSADATPATLAAVRSFQGGQLPATCPRPAMASAR